MKKSLIAISCLYLGGCDAIYTANPISGISPGVRFPHQDTAPLPWISIIPSKRALAMKDVDFTVIDHQMRFDMSFFPHHKRFQNVCLILLDYGLVSASKSKKNQLIVKYEGQTYSKNYEDTPEHYVMKISFFNGKTRPPSPPSFEETITMEKNMAPAHEAMIMMGHELVEDLQRTPLNQVTVDLD